MVGLLKVSRYSYGCTLEAPPPGSRMVGHLEAPGFRIVGLFKAPGFRNVGLLEEPRYSYGCTPRGPLVFIWLDL